jgi:hypothetical protein
LRVTPVEKGVWGGAQSFSQTLVHESKNNNYFSPSIQGAIFKLAISCRDVLKDRDILSELQMTLVGEAERDDCIGQVLRI